MWAKPNVLLSGANLTPGQSITSPNGQYRLTLQGDGNLIEFYWGIDQVGWEGRPRAYAPIEEIDLDSYDFAAFVREREAAAAALSDAASPALVTQDETA